MTERNLAGELALLATEVDSLAKALAHAQAELARESARRVRAEADAEDLREQLAQTRQRAKAAEREVGKLAAGMEAGAHDFGARERELEKRLEQAHAGNERLRQELERNEAQRRALEASLHDVMKNLRNAAQEASRV
jgi:chromosome segregation ATPase